MEVPDRLPGFVAALVIACILCEADAVASDPLDSPGWRIVAEQVLAGAPYRFDDRVSVHVPEVAEDPTRVPLHVQVTDIPGIQRIVVAADLNPITRAVTLLPEHRLDRVSFGTQIKVEQATPVRAAVLDDDGLWHVGGTWVSAAGGGCSAPSLASVDPSWSERLGEAGGRIFRGSKGVPDRLKFSVVHPMDAGFVSGVPRLYIQETSIHAIPDGKRVMRMLTTAAVSENPVFAFDFTGIEGVAIQGRDNNGNRFALRVAATKTVP